MPPRRDGGEDSAGAPSQGRRVRGARDARGGAALFICPKEKTSGVTGAAEQLVW